MGNIYSPVLPFIRGDAMSDLQDFHDEAPRFEIRCVDLDHWGEVRDLHTFVFRRLTAPPLESGQRAAIITHIQEPEYTLTLQTHDLVAAWFDRHIVGTAGWVPFDERKSTARIASVCVSPLFRRLGVGRRLVEAIEERATLAGFHNFTVRVFPPYTGFFETLGYARSSQGVQSFGAQNDLPVVFMRKGDISVETLDLCSEAVGAPAGEPKR